MVPPNPASHPFEMLKLSALSSLCRLFNATHLYRQYTRPYFSRGMHRPRRECVWYHIVGFPLAHIQKSRRRFTPHSNLFVLYLKPIPSHTVLVLADQTLTILLRIIRSREQHTLVTLRLLVLAHAAGLNREKRNQLKLSPRIASIHPSAVADPNIFFSHIPDLRQMA